jgi:hypothetical protein
MNILLAATQKGFLQTIGSYLRNRDGDYHTSVVFIVIACLIGLAWLLIIAYDRWSRQSGSADAEPQSLWDELCAAHALTADEIALLEQAQLLHGADGVTVFVDPRILRAIEDAAVDKSAVTMLGEKLFGPVFGRALSVAEPVGKFPQLSAG